MARLNLKPEFLTKNGRKEFVVLTVEDYERLTDALEDAEDLRILRKARTANEGKPTVTLEQMRAELGRNAGKGESIKGAAKPRSSRRVV
jgi:PHD/YefM family antitoxin component YafN of YafNO toxin-antitoxin module